MHCERNSKDFDAIKKKKTMQTGLPEAKVSNVKLTLPFNLKLDFYGQNYKESTI